MKPYLYILAVLLVGGSIGYYIGQRMQSPRQEGNPSSQPSSNDQAVIVALLTRQTEAYAAHDELLLFRDCLDGYIEVNATTGETFNLQAAVIRHHELFRPGKAVNIRFANIDVSLMQNAALARGTYSKTSDQYEQEGFAGLAGQVVWLLSKEGNRWRIAASAWTEERKE